MSLLALDDLTVAFSGRPVLSGVSLRIEAGEVVALVGPSGAGKSTLLAAAIDLLPPGAAVTGERRIAGQDLDGLDEAGRRRVRGRQVGLVMQDPARALNPARPIGAQVAEAARLHRGLPRREASAEAARLLADVGLDLSLDRYPHQLSGGQRQRVAVAAAVAAAPALLLADEPTAALDPVARTELATLLVRLAREHRKALLLVSHDLPLVAGIADRIMVLDRGTLVEEGPAVECLERPRSAALQGIVAAEQAQATAPPPGTAAGGAPLLGFEQVTRRFRTGTWLRRGTRMGLSAVSLAVAPGETVALVGASGSGKTTLARLALALDHPDAGRVLLDGRDRAAAKGRIARTLLAQVQAVFQDPGNSLDPSWTVAESVAEPLALSPDRLTAAERAARVADALQSVGLSPDHGVRAPDALSGGQRQRAALARALVLHPKLLVLDEAFSALDPALRSELADRLLAIQRARGTALLLVSHDLALVRRLAHRLMVLRDGLVVEAGPTASVLAAPRDPYTAALVAASPTLSEALSRRATPPSVPTVPASPPR
jgi:peptide/nickel transport system ATP-binding protein